MMYVKVPAGAFNKEKVLVGAFFSKYCENYREIVLTPLLATVPTQQMIGGQGLSPGLWPPRYSA